MCRRLICVLSFVLVLSMCLDIAHGQAGLIGCWKFDEASGTTASDSSGSGNNGTLANGVAWRPGEGMSGGALFVNPADASGYCEISTVGIKVSEGTFMVWGKLADPQPMRTSYFMGHTTQPVWTNRIQLYTDSADNLLDLGLGDSHTRQTGIVDLALETWYHIALTWDAGAYVVYVNGEEMTRGTYGGLTTLYPIMDIGNDGHDQRTREEAFGGLLDEMKIFDRALTAEEIQQAMRLIPPGAASEPSPADKATDVSRDVVLSWTPGDYAPATNGHKVYLGENFTDVNDATDGITQSANSYAPGRLNFGTTYYWRVDEVNGPPDYTVYQGDVWSFTTEPVGYAIENIIATASSAHQADMGPENTINGSGLDANDLHSTEQTDMWLSSTEPLGAWIQYEFDKTYKLHEMWVWNSNQTIEPVVGFGLKDVTIEYSANGTDYTTLGTTHEFARATGTPDYAHNTTVDLGGVTAKYVRLTANSNWGGIVPQYGLSEVRFFHIPVHATEPYPDSGATGVEPDVVLGWHVGREAVTHDVYISTDEQAVIDGTAPVATMTETSYGPLSLDLGVTYYWRVDEVNEAEIPTTWQSNIWNFTISDHIVVDDFESYNDLDPEDPESNRIFLTWIDGWEVATNGSQVGYTEPPFCERTIVHGDEQSMPFFYNNTAGAAYSEAELTLSPSQDWSKHGVKTLSLWFHGDPNNTAAQMYVKVNGSKVTYDGEASNLTLGGWQVWSIDLASVGTNVQNVTTLSIGIDGNGAIGKLLFDDIGLYSYSRQLITPTDPGNTGLVAHYKLDQNASDSSGNGHNGTVEGAPTWSSPGWDGTGSCMQFGGDSDRITVESFDLTGSGITLSAWIRPSSFKNDARMISKSQGSGTADHYWAMILSGNGENNLEFRFRTDAGSTTRRTSAGSGLQINEWTHVAATWDASDPYMRLYKNGREIDSVSKAGTAVATGPGAKIGIGNQSVSAGPVLGDMTRPFDGLMDEVRVYDRTVSVAEMAWLAGRTKPFDEPF